MISYPIKNKTKTQKAKSKNWVVPEKIHTSPTNGILEILTGGGGVKDQGNPGGREG